MDGMMQRHEADFISAYRVNSSHYLLTDIGSYASCLARAVADKEINHRVVI